MINRMLRKAGAPIFASLLVFGCAPGEHPFLMVQMCLSNEQGVAKFIDQLKLIAATEKMDFVDNSSNTKRDLDTIGYRGHEREDGSPVINMGVLRKDGLGIGAGNLGLPGYQVALGFSAGSDEAEAREFANRVIERLVHPVKRSVTY